MHNSNLIRKMSAEYADYLFDESRTMGSADFIAFPANEAELAEVVRRCAEKGIPLTAQGALTGLAGGASPERGLVLNLQRMNRILGMRKDAEGTVYVRVQPGLRLAQLRRALAVKAFDVQGWDGRSIEVLKEIKPGQLFFPPDPTEPYCTLRAPQALQEAMPPRLAVGSVGSGGKNSWLGLISLSTSMDCPSQPWTSKAFTARARRSCASRNPGCTRT